jgi:hypothetical protein
MPLNAAWLPMATPFDPAEEPPGSLDPLGTLTYAERLAEVMLPAFTVRMWRARLLTFAAVAAAVADRTVVLMDSREDVRLEARLAFERLFVAAMVRLSARDPANYERALPQLPGRELASRALLAGEPLTRTNFLKGQAVNGPFGVIARLARQVELVDTDGLVGRNASSLLIAWSENERIPGVLDEDGSSTRAGVVWMNDAVKATSACLSKREWPGPNHRIWEQLALHLRPDKVEVKERRALLQILETAPVRRRFLGLLKDLVDLFRETRRTSDRGGVEKTILLRGVRPKLGKDYVDRLIADVISAADTYEQTTSLLQQAFEGLIWGLKHRGGRAMPETVLADDRLNRHLVRTRLALRKTVPRLEQAMNLLQNQPSLNATQYIEPLKRLREDIVAAGASEPALAQAVLDRHARVQREKAKAQWVEREMYWTLMPGENRVSGDAPPVWKDTYLHPFKLSNAYAILRDLGRVRLGDQDAEE